MRRQVATELEETRLLQFFLRLQLSIAANYAFALPMLLLWIKPFRAVEELRGTLDRHHAGSIPLLQLLLLL